MSPQKNGGAIVVSSHLPPSNPTPCKGCKVTKPMWISEIRRPSRRGVLTTRFGRGLRPFFFRGEAVVFFFGCTFKWKETDIREINRDCGRNFLCSFFLWDFDGCVFFGWMFRQSKMVPEISPVVFFLDEANWFARMTMIWVGGIVLLRGQWHFWVKPVFGWRIFSHAAQGELPAFIQLAQSRLRVPKN